MLIESHIFEKEIQKFVHILIMKIKSVIPKAFCTATKRIPSQSHVWSPAKSSINLTLNLKQQTCCINPTMHQSHIPQCTIL